MSENKTELVERTNLITPDGYRKLVEELDFLLKKERPRIVDEVHHAALLGDRSENAEYQYGKRRLRQIDSRVRFLNKRIEIARIIDPREQNPDCVRFGAWVTVEDESAKVKSYQLVGEDEIDTAARRISWKSPIGRGLLKAKVGEWVAIETPAGEVALLVKAIDYK